MKSSENPPYVPVESPLDLPDTLENIVIHLPTPCFKSANLVSKLWHFAVANQTPKYKLLFEFNIPKDIVDSLRSIKLVYERLNRIWTRGQVSFLNERKLYQQYCSSGRIDENFLHLLDNDVGYLSKYFSGSNRFFLESNFHCACIIGNLSLIQFLIEKNNCKLSVEHVEKAITSGDLATVIYLMEERNYNSLQDAAYKFLVAGIQSGNVSVVQYLISKFSIHPNQKDMRQAVTSGSYEMVRFFHQTYNLTADNVELFDIEYCRSLKIIKYLVEVLNWLPKDKRFNNRYHGMCVSSGREEITQTAYSTGMIDIIEYIQEKFPCNLRCFTGLNNALKSGSLLAVKHALARLDSTSYIIKNTKDNQTVLLSAIQSGNLQLVKFLVEEYNIKPTRKELLEYATESGSIAMMNYLVSEHGYIITNDTFKKSCHYYNLALIFEIFDRSGLINPLDVSYRCQYSDSLMLVYHLITSKNYQPDAAMLEQAFSGYKWNKGKDLLGHFIEYLVKVHHLTPTEEMISWVIEKGDKKMLLILKNEEVQAEEEDDFGYEESKCRIS